MKIVDEHGNDVTAQRYPWCISLGVGKPPDATGLVVGDRLYDDNGVAWFVADARGSGSLVNCPPPWRLIDAAFVDAGLEPCGP